MSRSLHQIMIGGFLLYQIGVGGGPIHFPGTKRWEFEFNYAFTHPPAIGKDGTVYCATGSGLVAVSSNGVGKRLTWTRLPWIDSMALGDDDTMYVTGIIWEQPFGNADPTRVMLHAYSSDGVERWSFRYPWEYDWKLKVLVPAVTGTESVLIGKSSLFARGSLFALDASGRIQWEHPIGRDSELSDVVTAPDGSIYLFTTRYAGLTALNSDGTEKWTMNLGFAETLGAAIGPDGSVYFGPKTSPMELRPFEGPANDQISCVAPDGSLKWRVDTQYRINSSLVIDAQGGVYFATFKGKLLAFDASGQKKWEFQAPANITGSPAVAANGEVYFGTSDARLNALQPNGFLKWTYEAESGPLSSPVIASDGTVYVTSGSKLLAIYGGSPPAERGWPMYRGDTRHSGGVPKRVEIPQSPAGLKVSKGRYGVEIEWETVAGAASYEVWRNGRNDPSSAVPVAVNVGGQTAYRDFPPILGGIYHYWVRSRNGAGLSEMGQGLPGSARPAKGGDLLWRLLVDSVIWTDPVLEKDGSIVLEVGDYFAEAEDNKRYRIDAAGRILETRWIPSPNRYLSSSAAGVLGFPGPPPAVASDGQFATWTAELPSPIFFSPGIGPDGTIYVGAGTNLHAIDSEGRVRWSSVESLTYCAGPVIGLDGSIYVRHGRFAETLSALDSAGRTKWKFQGGNGNFTSPVLSADGTIYFGSKSNFFALGPDGSVKWVFNDLGEATRRWRFGSESFPPALGTDGTVYVAANTNLFALDQNGKILWRYTVREGFGTAPVVSPGGVLYIGGDRPFPGDLYQLPGAYLYAIKIGAGPLVHPWPMYGHDPQHTFRSFQRGIQANYFTSDGRIAMTLALELKHEYRLETSVDFQTWSVLTNFTSTSIRPTVIDSVSTNSNRLFYRLAVP